MARKGEDLLAELDQLGSVEQAPAPASPASNKKPPKPSSQTKPPQSKPANNDEDDDGLAEIQAQIAARPTSTSRPATPRLSSSNTSAGTGKRADQHTPASSGAGSGRNSGEGRSYHQSTSADMRSEKTVDTTAPQSSSQTSVNGGGGWWGSMFSAASAAVKQAEALAKDIRGNEEVQKWADQARGNLSHLSTFGTDLRSRALPTFTHLLSHIAPPISAHERLQIHITHDLKGYPSLDPVVFGVFERVMAQVEGGDILVLQRGGENRGKSREGEGFSGTVLGGGGGGGSAGWTDGPWWRDEGVKREFGVVSGLKEGTRLARVSAESYAKEFFDSRGGVEEAAKRATELLSETNPVRSSDIFLAIQAVSYDADKALFAGDARVKQEGKGDETVVEPDEEQEELVVFAVHLHDPIHSLSFSILSQPFPAKWATWLDASTTSGEGLPESVLEIISSGGVDPREWVAEWVQEVLSLGVGVVAQRYVARRMGVGEGGLGRGKRRAEEESTAGELARTGI